MATISRPPTSAFLKSPVSQPTAPVITSKTPQKRSSAKGRATKASAATSDGVTKPKQSKSRNGCVTCKAKRLKCDEIKPSCQQCHKRNVTCGGYKKDFKWRSFEETAFTSKPPAPRSKKDSTSPQSKLDAPTSPSTSEASTSTAGNWHRLQKFEYQDLPAVQLPITPVDIHLSHPDYPYNPNAFSFDSREYTSHRDDYAGTSQPFLQVQPVSTNPGAFNNVWDDGGALQSSTTGASSYSSGQSPRLIDLLQPGTDLNAPPLDFADFRPQESQLPYQPSGGIDGQQNEIAQDDEVEEIIRRPDPAAEAKAWVMRLPSPSPSSTSSSSAGSGPDQIYKMHRNPQFHMNSPEMLMVRFDQQTCGILSVKDGPTENPWRTLVWPLARESPTLYHAISSLTAFQISKEKPEMRIAGMDHFRQSITGFASNMCNMPTETALAITLVLAFSESWDRHISTGIAHLRGAKILVNQALEKYRKGVLTNEEIVRMRFLCNSWVYMDVIARLTSVDDDDSNDFENALSLISDPFAINNKVDPLMGCASTLFPLIGRVANLVRRVRRTPDNSIVLISQANELKAVIEGWEPPDFFEEPEDPTSDIQHSLQTAEAYRWATLLYLHQAVPEIPSPPAEILAKKVLKYLATVPVSSRAIIVHIYPLLAAGCEATGLEDRAWVEDRWAAMTSRMLIGNIDRCWEVMKEVWDRRDSYDAGRCGQQHRGVNSTSGISAAFTSPLLSNKRKLYAQRQDDSRQPFDRPEALAGNQQTMMQRERGISATPAQVSLPRRPSAIDNMEFERTVRGRQHWLGVMKDWKWEVLLG